MQREAARRTRPPGSPLLCAAALLVAGAGALAAGPAPDRPTISSRDQLRACMRSGDELRAQAIALQRQLDSHLTMAKAVQDDASTLVDAQRRLDIDSAAEVDTWNAAMEQHNRRVEDHNRQAELLRDEQGRYNAAVLAHNERCAPRAYLLPDMDAVQKERKAAKAKASI